MVIFLARPRSSIFTFSSLMPRSSVMALPPVRIAMSSSMALRRSPNPGAFTAAQWSVPRSLFTTRVARASPSTSSAMMRKGLPARATCSSSGSISFMTLIFFSWIRMRASSSTHSIRSIRDEVGREVAAVELHALDHVEYRLRGLGLFHGDDAVLAHLLHGLGNEAADGLVVVGSDRRDLRDLLLVLRRLGHLLQLFRHEIHGPVDTALEAHGVGARRDVLQALADDGVREHGGGGGAVTRDVGGLGGDLLHHLSAHVLVVVLELNLLGHRHAILGDGGAAELLVDDHVAALGAHGRLHGGRHDVDPAEQRRTPLVAENHLLWHLILPLISVDGMGRPVRSGRNASLSSP